MKRIELFKVALEHCEKLSQKFPDLEVTSSIRNQLKYLISCESTSDIDKSKLEKEEKETYKELGENIIKEGKYAVVTMAGGQGTRLGHKGPKGTFKVSVNGQEKYLFQIIVESLQKAIEEYGVAIKWYIMVSSENEKDTKTFLKEILSGGIYFGT